MPSGSKIVRNRSNGPTHFDAIRTDRLKTTLFATRQDARLCMEKEITVLDDTEFERVAVLWGYDLDQLRAEMKSQGQDTEIDSLSRVAAGVQWIIIRKSRWEEIQEMEATRPGDE